MEVSNQSLVDATIFSISENHQLTCRVYSVCNIYSSSKNEALWKVPEPGVGRLGAVGRLQASSCRCSCDRRWMQGKAYTWCLQWSTEEIIGRMSRCKSVGDIFQSEELLHSTHLQKDTSAHSSSSVLADEKTPAEQATNIQNLERASKEVKRGNAFLEDGLNEQKVLVKNNENKWSEEQLKSCSFNKFQVQVDGTGVQGIPCWKDSSHKFRRAFISNASAENQSGLNFTDRVISFV